MDQPARSQYLAQALSAMNAQDAGMTPSVDLGGMKKIRDQRVAWESANPGQDWSQHRMQELGRTLQGVPAQMMAAPGNIAQSLGGLFQLGRAAGR